MSDLAPSYDARPATRGGEGEKPRTRQAEATRDGGQGRETAAAGRGTPGRESTEGSGRRDGAAGPAATAVAAARPVVVEDPSGDLSRSLEGAPASADVVTVRLDRAGDMVAVRTTFAAPVPARQNGSKGMNVASFYDVDDNGIVDYEVWASLADNGWGTGHLDRRRQRARFGPSTGIEVRVQGATLVTRFPLDRIGNAESFRWSAASEWGSYQSMAASTSARDYAPDDGAVDYPR
jgi:hypothetical protein